MSEAYNLVLKFPDQSPSFTHGFEAGQWYPRLEQAKTLDVEAFGTSGAFPIHAENEGLMIDMARTFGYRAIISPCADEAGNQFPEWTNVRFEKVDG